MITLTESAAKEVEKFKESAKSEENAFLRVKVVAGGCSGYSYGLNLDTNFDETKDSKYNFHGVDLVVDKKSELFMDGATINYVETLEQRGFHIENPQSTKSCGCGSSFQV
jgi:iron-sulfur cluster assembly protein